MPLNEAEKCLFLSRCWEILSKKRPAGTIYYNGLPEKPAAWAAFAYWVVPLVLNDQSWVRFEAVVVERTDSLEFAELREMSCKNIGQSPAARALLWNTRTEKTRAAETERRVKNARMILG